MRGRQVFMQTLINHGVERIFGNPGTTESPLLDSLLDYPQFTDPSGDLQTALGVTGLPATAFLSGDGTVLEVHQGALTAAELRDSISRLFPSEQES